MKTLYKCLLGVILIMAQQSWAQSPIKDSAAIIVDKYLDMINYNGIRSDSILYIETTIVSDNQLEDTLIMKRWFFPKGNTRLEFWQYGKRQTCFHSNDDKIFRKYDTIAHAWTSETKDTYHAECDRYNYYGPLYKWEISGVELIYRGVSSFEGSPIYVIHVECPEHYDRNYFFEQNSGVLFFVQEFPTIEGKPMTKYDSQVDWRAIHEYKPFGESLLPSVESYQYHGVISILRHTYKYVAYNKDIFEKDYPKF